MRIGVIGLGNMAKAIIGGIVASDKEKKYSIIGADPVEECRKEAVSKYGIEATSNNEEVVKAADILLLAVKPQFLKEAIAPVTGKIPADCIVISIIAGKNIAYLEKEMRQDVKLVRCMPNTPALVCESCTGVCRNALVTDDEFEIAMEIVRSFGKAIEVPESMMDAVCGVSGSAPAYVFMFIEAMADAAVYEGMPRQKAYEFAAQAVMGSAKLMLETGKHPGELKDMVCSPGGTTIEAVKILEEKGLRSAVMDAVVACTEKSKKL